MSVRPSVLFPLLILLALAGCAGVSPRSDFHVLSPVVESGAPPPAVLRLGVGPVRLPDYLDRNQMVRLRDETSIEVDEFNRWGGDLARNIQDVLAENLSRLLGSQEVVTHPWSSTLALPLQLVIDIRRFDLDAASQVVLDLQWRLIRNDGRQPPVIRNEHIVVPAGDGSPAAQVKAMNQALAELARRIAAVLSSRQDG